MPSEDQSQELSKNTTSKIHEKGSCHQCAVFVDVKTCTRHQILLFLDTVEAQDRSVKGKSRHACSLPKWKKTNSCPSVRSEPPPQPEAQVVCSTACEDCGVRHALFLNSEVAPEDSTTRIATNWDRRLGECCRQTRTSCSVFRVRDTSCEAVRAKLCLREGSVLLCLTEKGYQEPMFSIFRFLFVLLLGFTPVLLSEPTVGRDLTEYMEHSSR